MCKCNYFPLFHILVSVSLSLHIKLWAHILHRVHTATGVQCWPDLSTFPPACLCAPNIPLSSALHSGTLWGYGGHFDRDGCAGALLPSNGSCHTHSAPLHSHSACQCWAVSARHWEDGLENQETDRKRGPKEKGLHTGKLVQADDAMQERHVVEGCEQVYRSRVVWWMLRPATASSCTHYCLWLWFRKQYSMPY